MPADVAMQHREVAENRDEPAAPAAVPRWDLLGRLEKGTIGTRQADGTITVGRAEVAGCFLYGPYLHFPKGRYRLRFRCRCGAPRMAAQPLLGIEIIVLSRFQQQWRDFTAMELSSGSGWLDFEVSDEHSLEGENEGRFEFRFFHFGNSDLAITEVVLDALPPETTASAAAPSRWRLLGRLQKSWFGRRDANGRVNVTAYEPAGRLLYGGWPYLRLPGGVYRLRVTGSCRSTVAPGRPVLAVEVLGQSRWLSRRGPMLLARLPETNGDQIAWRDIAASELADGVAALDFTVPSEMSMEAGADAPFDIRLHHLGGAALAIDGVELTRLDDGGTHPVAARTWRLLAGAAAKADPVLLDRRIPLRLTGGRYRLSLVGVANDAGEAAPRLRVELAARQPLADMVRSRERLPAIVGRSEVTIDPRTGVGALEFDIPPDFAAKHADWRCELTVRGQGDSRFRLAALELRRLPEDELGADLPVGPPRPRPQRTGRRKVVIIGNCQSETLRQGFARSETLNRQFDVKYHFIQLPKNLHEFAIRDLASCDVLLYQDIRLWDEFPLRDAVRPGADSVPFPLVRFASLWPFDSWNGPGDKEAYDREAPNLTFPYLDGLLGRIRKDIPDPEARFQSYRRLDMEGVVNYRRLHDMEVRRLVGMDRKFDVAIGSFILENFQNRRVFHTTVRPNWEVFTLLMQFVARQVGVSEPISLGEGIDASLRNPQVPIHPKVARDLGVKWVDESTGYLNRGIEVTWETYIRSYIEHYG